MVHPLFNCQHVSRRMRHILDSLANLAPPCLALHRSNRGIVAETLHSVPSLSCLKKAKLKLVSHTVFLQTLLQQLLASSSRRGSSLLHHLAPYCLFLALGDSEHHSPPWPKMFMFQNVCRCPLSLFCPSPPRPTRFDQL